MLVVRPLVERFWEKVKRGAPDACWEWQRARNEDGYGKFLLNGENVSAHRVCWMLERGPIPADRCVCHTCDNPPCVNPAHLFLGTHLDNMRDRDAKGRLNTPKGERAKQSDLTWERVREIRARYANDPGLFQHELGREFGVDQTAIERIVTGKTWKEPGMLVTRRGKRRGNPTKLTPVDVREIRSLAAHESQRSIAEHFGVSSSMVCNIVNRKAWSHV